MNDKKDNIIIKFPDGTQKRVLAGECVVFDAGKETMGFAWAAHGLRFQFPVGKSLYEYTMSKADAKNLRDWLNENLPE